MNRKPAGILLVAEETLGGYRLPREARDDHAAYHDRVFAASQAGSAPHCAWPGDAAEKNHESHWRKRYAH